MNHPTRRQQRTSIEDQEDERSATPKQKETEGNPLRRLLRLHARHFTFLQLRTVVFNLPAIKRSPDSWFGFTHNLHALTSRKEDIVQTDRPRAAR